MIRKDIDFSVINLNTVGTKKRRPKKEKVSEHLLEQDSADNLALLDTARTYWDSLSDFRKRRKRSRLYYRGDQWHELIIDPDDDTKVISEEDYIKNQGKLPLKQNIMRQLGRNLLGQYRANPSDTMVVARDRQKAKDSEVLTVALRNALDLNDVQELDARKFEEYLLSGLIVDKVGYKFWRNRNTEDAYIKAVSSARVFFNTDLEDIRMLDLSMIGEIADMTIQDVVSVFAKNPQDEELIRSWYTGSKIPVTFTDALSAHRIDNLDFFITTEPHLCRVIEIWSLRTDWRIYGHDYADGSYNIYKDTTMDDIDMINQGRIEQAAVQGIPEDQVPLIEAQKKNEQFWYVKFLTPYGQCLYEGETPYMHEEHPYVIRAYPMVDGEVWGLMEDLIDQQRYINRLISLQDFMMGTAAKGVLLVPEDSIPADMDIDDFAEEWSSFRGVIKIKVKPGAQLPKQISSNIANIGVNDMLALQMKFIQDIAGVQSAMQGQKAHSGTSAALYAQETQNAATNSKDLMEFFTWFKKNRDMKVLKVIRQYYQEKRYLSVAGTHYSDDASEYDPDRVRDLDVDVTLAQSIDTPVFRQLTDDLLMGLLDKQLIDLPMYLENSSMPFADKLLEQIKSRQEGGGQLSADMLGSNPEQALAALPPQNRAVIEQLLQDQPEVVR
ncbi:hypothetical protein DRQ25_15265 [Candidatus Fermentibacteria bacterium]|nr:MAG: hypothetical protein DRQ25_15265 [Candidatus Fermentibacteria bacterium]